jgi:hypothetical protein
MGSFANILLFIPLLFCSMLATMTSACCSLGMSAGHYLTTLAYQTAQTVVHPFIVCYDVFIRRYNALVSCCWTCWSCAYTVMSYPFVFCADLLQRPIKLMTNFAHTCNAAITWWLRFALTIITTPWRATYYALCITRQLFTSWAHVVVKLSSCAGTIVPAIWTQLKKETLQLLWALQGCLHLAMAWNQAPLKLTSGICSSWPACCCSCCSYQLVCLAKHQSAS